MFGGRHILAAVVAAALGIGLVRPGKGKVSAGWRRLQTNLPFIVLSRQITEKPYGKFSPYICNDGALRVVCTLIARTR